MRRLCIPAIVVLVAGCPAAPRTQPGKLVSRRPVAPPPDADAGVEAPEPPTSGVAPVPRAAQAAAQVAAPGPGAVPDAGVSIVTPSGPKQTLTSRMIMVGRADAESEHITMRLTFEGGTAQLVERFDVGPRMAIDGSERNPKRWKQKSVKKFTGTTAIEDGWRRFHLVGPDGRKLELTCMPDEVDALARSAVATETTCPAGCDCETVWNPPGTTRVSGLYCFDRGGITFQQLFTADQVDWVYENDACVRGDAYRLR